MKFRKWELALFAALFITILCGFSLGGEQSGMADKMIRLHVVANSDSDSDQALKLKVRDRVLEVLEQPLSRAADREEAEKIISDHQAEICAAAEKVVGENGCGYSVKVTLGREAFPTREYDTFALPAGYYTSLRVIIGAGAGHNWWCVVFPPMCASAAIEEDAETMGLTKGEASLITRDSDKYVIKFKAVEIVEKIVTAIGG